MKGQLLKEIAALTAFGQDRTRDAEDDVFEDGTSAVAPGGAGHDDGEGVGPGEWRVEGGKRQAEPAVRSKLRMAAGLAALEEEARYRGRKASRQALGLMGEEEEEESGSDEDEEEEEDSDEEDEESGSEGEEQDQEQASGSGSGSGSEEEEAETSSSAGASSGSDSEEDMARLRGDQQGMAFLLKRSRDEQLHKAEAAKRHRDMWNRLLEVRILLQRLLGMGNRLPRGQAHEAYCRAEPAVGKGLDGATSVLRGVLSQLVGLRREQAAEVGEEEEEEGMSSEQGGKRRRVQETKPEFTGPIGGRDDPWVASAGDYDTCKAQWRQVLDAAHQRATLSAAVGKKFRVVNQGLWHQVEASLADRTRSLRRSHLTRAQARAAGLFVGVGAEEGEEQEAEEGEPDEEAFDDAELYQLLLRDYIQSVGPAGGVDGLSATAALAGRGGLSKRSKRKGVDTKASKGRKLRYAVHPKLEHFMFPVPAPPAPMDVDRLFASLPGSSVAVLGGLGRQGQALQAGESDEE